MAALYRKVRYSIIRQKASDLRRSFECHRPPTPAETWLHMFADVVGDVTIKDGWTIRNPFTGHYRSLINLERPHNRVRWTMAHELAHIVLPHFEEMPPGGVPDKMFKWMEREANVFAEELLIPWDFVEGQSFRYLRDCAEQMEVSEEACAWRLLQVRKMYKSDGAAKLGLSDKHYQDLMTECFVGTHDGELPEWELTEEGEVAASVEPNDDEEPTPYPDEEPVPEGEDEPIPF